MSGKRVWHAFLARVSGTRFWLLRLARVSSTRVRHAFAAAASSRPMHTRAPCPCGGNTLFTDCCGRWLGGAAQAEPAECRPAPDAAALMRSRYSAFVLGDAPYLLATWHASTRPPSLSFEAGLRWLGLQVRQHQLIDANHAMVEFVARSKLGGRAHRLHEISRFVREHGRWFYVDGDLKSA